MIIKLATPASNVAHKVLDDYCKFAAFEFIDNAHIGTRLRKIEEYINTKFNKNYSIKELLKFCVEYSTISVLDHTVEIIIGNNISADGLFADQIARLVTYGNLEIKGHKILLDTFEYVKNML